jgi:serine/threonine-protein kinase
MWPLIAIVSLLAVALIAIIIVFAVQPNGGDEPSSPPPTTPSKTPTTPSASPTSDTVPIARADYIGLSEDEAIDKLNATGGNFTIDRDAGSAATSPDLVGKVQDINPVGNVRKGSTVTLTIYGAFPAPTAPTITGADPASGDVGDGVEVTWTSYAGCPSGYALQGYTATLTNATAPSTSLDANATSITIELGPTAGSPATVSLVARCAGDITSQPATISIPVN